MFAFANAGVNFQNLSFSIFLEPVSMGILLGLIFGKFLGISIFTRLMVAFRLCRLPEGLNWKHVYGMALLGAIGFTMSLFITDLAFDTELYVNEAKIGIFTASLLAGILGYFYLNLKLPGTRESYSR